MFGSNSPLTERRGSISSGVLRRSFRKVSEVFRNKPSDATASFIVVQFLAGAVFAFALPVKRYEHSLKTATGPLRAVEGYDNFGELSLDRNVPARIIRSVTPLGARWFHG